MTARGSTFCAIPAAALMAEMEEIGRLISEATPEPAGERDAPVPAETQWSQMGRERVVTFLLPGHPDSRPAISVFTSLAVDQDVVRDCGEDAIRIVVGAWALPGFVRREEGQWGYQGHIDPKRDVPRFVPAGDSRRIFRTAPRKGTEAERAVAFFVRLRQALREAYVQAKAIQTCPDCGRLMRRREGRHGAFLGCSGYPLCRASRAIPGENVGA